MSDENSLAPATVKQLARTDGRTRLARVARHTRAALTAALGGDVSPQQELVIRMIAESEGMRRAMFANAANGSPASVADFASLVAVGLRGLKMLGLRRHVRDVTLSDILGEAARRTEAAQDARSTSSHTDAAGAA